MGGLGFEVGESLIRRFDPLSCAWGSVLGMAIVAAQSLNPGNTTHVRHDEIDGQHHGPLQEAGVCLSGQ